MIVWFDYAADSADKNEDEPEKASEADDDVEEEEEEHIQFEQVN